MNGTQQLLPCIFFHTDSICSEDLPPLPIGSDDTWLHQGTYLPSEWEERARLEAVEALVVPDAMCLHGNPWHFLMKTKLLHARSLLLSWPNLLLSPRVTITGEEPRGSRPYPSPLFTPFFPASS